MATNAANYDQQVRQLEVLIRETKEFAAEAEKQYHAANAVADKKRTKYQLWSNRLKHLIEAQKWINSGHDDAGE